MVAERSSRPLVLVVDDYQDAREMYAESLGACGFSVAEAETGDEAVAKAFELVPDAIVMDLSLPGMDGWTATRTLKTDARTRAIPVVVAYGQRAHRRAGRGPPGRLRRVPGQAVPARGDRGHHQESPQLVPSGKGQVRSGMKSGE